MMSWFRKKIRILTIPREVWRPWLFDLFLQLAEDFPETYDVAAIQRDDPELFQKLAEHCQQSSELNLSIYEITDLLRKLSKQKARVYFAAQPSLALEHYGSGVIEFSPAADDLFVLVNEDPEVDWRIADQGGRLVKTGLIREVPRTVLEAAQT